MNALVPMLALTVQAGTVIPEIPAPVHIPEGCHPDATRYIAELAKIRLDVRAELLFLKVDDRVHGRSEHVLVLLKARGALYIRDEYYGVLDLDLPDGASPSEIQLKALAAIDRETRRLLASGDRKKAIERCTRAGYGDDGIKAVQTLKHHFVPSASLYLIRRMAVAVWHDSPERVCVYSPKYGTLTLERKAPLGADVRSTDRMIAEVIANTYMHYPGRAVPIESSP